MASDSRPVPQGQETGTMHPGAFDRVRYRALMVGVAAAAAGLLVACGSGSGNGYSAPASGTSSAQQNAAAGMTVSTRTVAGVGTVLTDQSGKTLYTPQQEASGAIKCTAACLGFWFPVTVGKGTAPHAASTLTGTLSSIQRPDGGSRQVTYNGKPLYTFRLDNAPGQAHGNNFTDQFGSQTFSWQAVTVGGTSGAPSQPGSPSSSYNPYPSSSSGYGGY